MRLAVCPKVRISLIWDIESLLDFTLGSSFHMQSKGVCLFRGDFFAMDFCTLALTELAHVSFLQLE